MRRETPRSPAPPLERGRAVSRLAVQLDQAPIGIDVARRALRGVCPGTAITAVRHCCAFRRPRRLSADHAALAASGCGKNSNCHESRTKNLFSRILAASGPNVDFAACHYPRPRTGR